MQLKPSHLQSTIVKLAISSLNLPCMRAARVSTDMLLRSWWRPSIRGRANGLLKSPIKSGLVEALSNADLMVASVSEKQRWNFGGEAFWKPYSIRVLCGDAFWLSWRHWRNFLLLAWMGLCLSDGGSGRLKEPLLFKCNDERALDANWDTGDSGFGEKSDWSNVRTTLDCLKREVRTWKAKTTN